MEMRAKSMVLILVNLAMAAILIAAPAGDRSATGIFNCCKGEGPDAHCCYDCCWLPRDCKTDSDCRGYAPQ